MTHSKFVINSTIADDATSKHVLNMPRLLGSINRKAMHNVDKQGNAQLYTLGVKAYGAKLALSVNCAANTYYTRRAIKAWHDARVMMYKRAGISMKSLGYGRNLRPYLDVNHENGTTTELDTETFSGSNTGISPPYSGDEWTYSRAAVATPQENTETTSAQLRDLVDTYSFTLLDDSVTEDATADDPDESGTGSDQDSFVSVGMIAEWLDSFKKHSAFDVAASTLDTIDDDNALLQLRSQQSADKEEVLELAQEAQTELRPWDLAGARFSGEVSAGYLQSTSDSPEMIIAEVPCGLFNLEMVNTSGGSDIATVCVEVLDIRDM